MCPIVVRCDVVAETNGFDESLNLVWREGSVVGEDCRML